jgi:hypothetical protein
MSSGCEFDQPDEISRRQIIGFVYGDSRRLKYFSAVRQNARLFRGLITCSPSERLCATSPESRVFF